MKLFVCTDHDNHYVGVASVVIASDEGQARHLLDSELIKSGLKPFALVPYTFKFYNLKTPLALVLQDGDY